MPTRQSATGGVWSTRSKLAGSVQKSSTLRQIPWRHEETCSWPRPNIPRADGRIGDGVVGDHCAPHRNDRARHLHSGGISAHGDRESRGIAAIGNGCDDRARQEGRASAMAQAGYRQRSVAASKDLSERQVAGEPQIGIANKVSIWRLSRTTSLRANFQMPSVSWIWSR